MNFETSTKILKISIHINYMLLFIVPISYLFGPLDSQDMGSEFGWYPGYFYTDELVILVLPFYLLWGVYLINKNKLLKTILTVLLIVSSNLFLLLCSMSIFVLAQDYQPYWGLLILALFSPLFMLFFIMERKSFQVGQMRGLDLDIILDEKLP